MQTYEDLYYRVADELTLYARDYPGPESRKGCVDDARTDEKLSRFRGVGREAV